MKEVRTRFAPSPTGFQHVGGFRTAMYAWLHARGSGGKFVLRVEDTDRERTVEGAVKYLIESLDWLGISMDEGPSTADLEAYGEIWDDAPEIGGEYGPYMQSLRLERYKEVSDKLIEMGAAYRCDCTAERLKEEREAQMARKETPGYSGYCRDRNVSADVPHVVRLRIPEDLSIALDDVVKGRIEWEQPPLRDTVLLKSDGYPTYHLACVVDDHHMKISHVFRGEEWISTTPVHLLLYDVLGWERPEFCHLSLIMGKDGKKLGKRHGAVSLDEYKKAGYLPEAILHYVVRIGWSLPDGDEQEIFTDEELVEKFSIDNLSKSNGTFDNDKLDWMNGMYIRRLSDERFEKYAREQIEGAGLEFCPERWKKIAPHAVERVKLLPDIVPLTSFLFSEEIERDMDAMINKKTDKETAARILEAAKEELATLETFDTESIEETLRGLAEKLELKTGQIFMTLRIAVTGTKVSPPLFESIEALGKEEALRRLVFDV